MRSKSGRLKNFCQICRKQCKDENGFHCHLNSASHQRKVRQHVANPNQHIQKYSKQLEYKIIQTLKIKYPGQAKNINDIWSEYSEQKYHIDFKKTQWRNLQQFTEHLKSNKNLSVIGTFPAVRVTYLISKTSDFISQQKRKQHQVIRQREKEHEENALKNKIQRIKQIEQQHFNRIQQQMKKKHQSIQDFDQNQRLFIKLDGMDQAPKRNPLFQTEALQKQVRQEQPKSVLSKKTKNADLLLQKINAQKPKKQNNFEEQKQQKDFQWILKGIQVRIKPHDISAVFHGKKAKIIDITQPYVAKIQVGSATLQIDQTYLETVVPKINHKVKLLQGQKRGIEGVLEQVYIEEGFGVVNVEGKLFQIPFDFLSKIQ